MNNVFAGIRINGKHTYFDYGLFLAEPPNYGSPEPRVVTLDIPGMNGVLDYTEAITGDVTYTNRQQVYSFFVEIGRWKREALKSELMDAIHGQRVEIIPDEFPEWYFDGRAVVSFDEIDAYKMKVVIEVDAKPFRFAVNETEVTISAGDMWTQQTIYFGRGTENQGSNSIFYFGSSSRNTFDFSSLLRLNFSWIDAPYRANPVIQLNDTYGHTYQKNAAVTGPTGYDSIELDNIGTVDASKIWRVLVSGIGRVDMYGVPSGATYFGQIHNDRMPVVPYFESHFENDIDVMLNGVGATISPGNNYIPELRLREGENDLYVYDLEATSSEYIVVRYREGRL